MPGKSESGQNSPSGERIAKAMARAGLCSRRDAEAWIAEGRVAVNGKVLTSPALNVGENDVVADLERSKGMYSWASIVLKEGKNREVKRLMERLGLKVARLIRVQYGPFH